jgi:transcriptional regulator with XRE-family HTH domain
MSHNNNHNNQNQDSNNTDNERLSPQGDADLGRRLSSIRLRAGLTQADIARKVAVSRQHISNIETGNTSPTVRVLQGYLQTCGMDLAEFCYGPLPINQTPRQREYHGKLQALLENDAVSPVVIKVLDSFMTSTQSSVTELAQPLHLVRQARARRKNEEF